MSDNPNQDLIKFLREENEKNRSALREEADANRKLFNEFAKWFSFPLAVLLALGGYFFGHSLNDIENEAKTTETTVVNSERASIEHVQSDAQDQIRKKLQEILTENGVKERVFDAIRNDEFLQKSVQGQVGMIAKQELERQEGSIAGKLHEQLHNEVAKQVHAETPTIDNLVQDRVSKVVDDIRKNASARPTIRLKSRSVDEGPNSTVVFQGEFQNVGNATAIGVRVYTVTSFATLGEEAAAREAAFRALAQRVGSDKIGNHGETPSPVPAGSGLSITAKSNPLSDMDQERLANGSLGVNFLLWIEYSSPGGGAFYAYSCGTTGGTLERIVDCPSSLDYKAAVNQVR